MAESARGTIDLDVMRRILADRYDVVARRRLGNYNCVCSKNTVQSVVFEPQKHMAWVSHKQAPAPLAEYLPYALAA